MLKVYVDIAGRDKRLEGLIEALEWVCQNDTVWMISGIF